MNFHIVPQNEDKENSLIPMRKNSKSDSPQEHSSLLSSQHQKLIEVVPPCFENELYKIKCENQRRKPLHEQFRIELCAIIEA